MRSLVCLLVGVALGCGAEGKPPLTIPGGGGGGGSRRTTGSGGAPAVDATAPPAVEANAPAAFDAPAGFDAAALPGVEVAPTIPVVDAPAPSEPLPSGDGGGPPGVGAALDVMPVVRGFGLVGVATWRGDAAAAYSLVHDDVCDPSVNGVMRHAQPLLKQRGLTAGFGVIVNRCTSLGRWDEVRALVADGHDVFNHSWEHPCMTADAGEAEACDPAAPRSIDFAREIDEATRVLRAEAKVESRFFAFPYDVCTNAAVAWLKTASYLGARCGDLASPFNASAFTDPFRVQFDVWGPAYSHYGQMPPCTGVVQYVTTPASTSVACRQAVLNRYVDDVISRKGWAVRELHGFDDDGAGGFEPLSVADYAAHLDHLAARAGDGRLWVAGPTEVIKYRLARERCSPPTLVGGTLRFVAPSEDCRKVATTLSYLVVTQDFDPAALGTIQAGRQRRARKLGPGRFAVDADPTAGDAVLAPQVP